MTSFLQAARERILVADGAIGSLIRQMGMDAREPPEIWCQTQPEEVRGIHRSYFEAGSDFVYTNSFGGNRFRLENFGLEKDVHRLNRLSAELARKEAGPGKWVFGSVGPTGQSQEAPLDPEEVIDIFAEQVQGLADGGVDGVAVETMLAVEEAEGAIRAAKAIRLDLPVIATLTFVPGPQGPRTRCGATPSQAGRKTLRAGADLIGANCTNGVEEAIVVLTELRKSFPEALLVCKPNAGLPKMRAGELKWDETPERMTAGMRRLVPNGINIFGGCCGTTPPHIRAMAELAYEVNQGR